jgi:uncharacterized protein
MNDPTTTSPSGPVPLTLAEQRVLGVLIEKQKTTPDVYPMTLNGLVTGCNQKSNREPVLNMTVEDVEDAIGNLHQKGMVVRVMSGRTDKWKHVLYELWNLERVELAILAELFLRGPQSEGELRGRVSRMDPVESLDALRGQLHSLSERGFVIYLTPEGRRGTTVTHTCQDSTMIDRLRQRAAEGARLDDTAGTSGAASPTSASRRPDFASELDELRKQFAELRLTVEALAEKVNALATGAGTAPPA